MKTKFLTLATDVDEIVLDHDVQSAILMIQDLSSCLGLSPMEFMAIFEHGIPSCPCCDSKESAGTDLDNFVPDFARAN